MAVSITRTLSSEIDVKLNWNIDDPNEGISQQLDVGKIQPEYEFATGTGIGQHDTTWYNEFTVTGNNSYDIDVTALPSKLFGIPVDRQFEIIKSITIENTSPSSHVIIGTSGLSNAMTMFGYSCEIGISGVAEATSLVGYEVSSTKRNIRITNPSSENIQCKVLILGVYGI